MKEFFKKNGLNITIILVFIIGALFMAQYHELWSDEAQSWLIARDLSVPEIIGYIKYEGTPPLWTLIIKLAIFVGLSYDYFYILPIIFMALGLGFMYTKFDIPWYLKILFPFTYYVFYQTTIVVRSYALILLAISMVAYYFDNRYKKPWKYCFSMIFFMSISLHTYVVAGAFYALTLLFLKKDYKKLEDKTKKQMFAVSIVLFLIILILLIILFPNSNFGFSGKNGKSIYYIIGESTLANNNIVIEIISSVAVGVLTVYIISSNYKENKSQDELIREIEKLFIVFPLIVIFMVLRGQVRYFAIFYFIIVLYFIKNKKYPIVKISLICIFAVQIVWNVKSCAFDYNEKYSVGEEIAEFLKEIDYKNKVVDALNYHVVEISPYFEENVFYHTYNSDDSFYSWNLNSNYLEVDQLLASNSDIYIVSVLVNETIDEETILSCAINLEKFLNGIDYSKYRVYNFEAFIPQKGNVNEHDVFLILVNEKVQKEIEEKGIKLNRENRKLWTYNFDEEEFKMIDFSTL